MGAYSVPAEIRNQKPKGTMVKRIGNDKFYVYEYSSSKIRVESDDGTFKWKTKTKMGKCIGTITLKEGYIPNAARISNDEITAKNYGDYAFAFYIFLITFYIFLIAKVSQFLYNSTIKKMEEMCRYGQ